MSGLHIVWFREDLRVHDHAALRAACQMSTRDGGEVMALYVVPGAVSVNTLLTTQDGQFLFEALADLRAALAQRDAVLHLRHGDVLDVLSDLHKQHRVLSIDCHECQNPDPVETQIEAWCLRAGARFGLHRQFHPGITPRAHESWQTIWERFMARPRHEAPDELVSANVGIGPWPALNLDTPSGGRKCGIQTLRRVLSGQGSDASALPSGKEAFAALLPHLRLGVVSLREVWQAAVSAHQQALKSGLDIRAAALASFLNLLPTAIAKAPHGPGQDRRSARQPKSVRGAPQGHQFSLGLGDSGQ